MILVSITQLILVSCHPTQRMISSFSDILYGDSSEIIDITGFYTELCQVYDQETGLKIVKRNYIFYPDQTVCMFYLEEDSLEKYDVHTSLNHCFYKWGRKKDKWGYAWGVYKKQGNHIHTELFDNIYLFTGVDWNCSKCEFVIKEDSLICKKILLLNQDGHKEFEGDVSHVYLFVPTESLPPQSKYAHLLKKRKWRWRDHKDWEEYMKQHNCK